MRRGDVVRNKKYGLFVILVLVSISLFVYFVFPSPPATLSSFDKRAVWFSYIDLNRFSYESKKDFENDFSKALEVVEKYKNNTVIVQVRPFADALYKSKLFPNSEVITKKKSLSFDPLEVMVELTHKKQMSIEAWLNPYRLSLSQNSFQQFVENSPKKSWIDDSLKVIGYGTHKYILNPESKEVRDYIVQGVEEIVNNYDVDGIHFDDYFYVEGTHGETTKNQRLDAVNMLISDVYSSIKRINQEVVFGVSPQGNYENCINGGADVDTWLKEEGYIDYLMPQFYWTDQYGHDGLQTLFSSRVQQFAGLKREKSIMLYAGLALYRIGEESSVDKGWKNSQTNMSDQIQVLSLNGYKGYCYFDYSSMNGELGQKELDMVMKEHPYN